jgi:hypothetical protein
MATPKASIRLPRGELAGLNQDLLWDTSSKFSNRTARSVTFQGTLDLPIHRWYRLTPSFSPQLAHDIADHFALSSADFVLDPFSGVGTVPLCMKYRGIRAGGVEINPYLQFVSVVKCRTYGDIGAIDASFDSFLGCYRAALASVPFHSAANRYLAENRPDIPPISFPERWWSPGNLAQLVCLRRIVADLELEPHHLELIKMGVLAILVAVSNARHDHVSLTFAEKPLETVDVARILETQFRNMVADLRAVADRSAAEVEIKRGNSKALATLWAEEPNFSAVITSPPYPNRFSYARETRPHLFFFDFIAGPAAVGALEMEAIGGTWGKATSVLARGIAPRNKVIETLLDPYLRGIPARGDLMANYVVKYFNDLFEHAGQVAKVCKRRARLAYVIGNSKFYDQPLPSDEILASVFAHFGFELERIDRMRKRQSKSGLYEAVVFMGRG